MQKIIVPAATKPGNLRELVQQLKQTAAKHPDLQFAEVTVLQSQRDALSKHFEIDENGELKPAERGALSLGTATKVPLANLEDLARVLQCLTPKCALAFGVTKADLAQIASGDQLSRHPGAIARTRGNFVYRKAQPGIFPIDIDFDAEAGLAPVTIDLFDDLLCRIAPWAGEADRLYAHSCSGGIHSAGGKVLRPFKNIRAYFMIKDASAIPALGSSLKRAFIEAGYVCKAGKGARTVIDPAIYWPGAIDYAGGASLGLGLTQMRPAPVLKFGYFDPVLDVPSGFIAQFAERPREQRQVPGKSATALLPEVADALRYLDAHEREDWLRVGMALHWSFGEAGRELWDLWSGGNTGPDANSEYPQFEGSPKYDPDDQERVWASFDDSSDHAITGRSIFKDARDAGWKGYTADASKEFGNLGEGARSKKVISSSAASIRSLSEFTPANIEWIWEGVLAAGKITLLAGPVKGGKSQVSAMIAATISNGGQWPVTHKKGRRGTVLIIQAEDGVRDTLLPRMMAAQADLAKVKIYEGTRVAAKNDGEAMRHFNLESDLEILGKALQEIQDVELIVIDPITAYMGKIDGNDTTQVRHVLDPLVVFAERHRVAVLAVTHLNKGSGDAIKRVIGSGAFTAVARINYMLVRDKEDKARRLLLPIGSNLGSEDHGFAFRFGTREIEGLPQPVSYVDWEARHVCEDVDELLQPEIQGGKEERYAKAHGVQFLKEELKDGPRNVNDLKKAAATACIAFRTLERAKNEAGVKSSKVGDRWVWHL